MNVLIVSGIWPPDVGGPASHAPELADWLRRRGHGVEVVTTADRAPAPMPYPVHWVSRSVPPGLRHLAAAVLVARRSRSADVVYATSMVGRTALATLVACRPFVAKIASDAAFDRARRRGVVDGDANDFQDGGGGPLAACLRLVRNWSVRRAAAVVCPSAYIAELAARWRGRADRVLVLPNPAPDPSSALPVERAYDGNLVVFAGRLTAQKNVGVAVRAMQAVPSAHLVVVGDGEERSVLEAEAGERVHFVGAQSRAEVLGLLAASDVVVLPSVWENFPHAAVEALAMGTPVVATSVGGVAEIVRDGENGLLVENGDEEAFRRALQRVLDDDELRGRLRAAAAPSVARFSADVVYGELERVLEQARR